MKIIIHCSDSNFGNSSIIDYWHRDRGFNGVGYHLIILNGQISSKIFNHNFDGHIETGRPFDDDNKIVSSEWAAATKGENDELNICLIGKSGKFSYKQLQCLEQTLLPMLLDQFGKIEIFQHSDFEPKKPYCAGLPKNYIFKLNQIFG